MIDDRQSIDFCGASSHIEGNYINIPDTSLIFPLNPSCSKVTPSYQPLSDLQKTGLKLTATGQGRDVVLAIDLTESVGLNDEGRLRLKQIVRDSLQSGDSVYVVPFASKVNPFAPSADPLAVSAGIPYRGKPADIDRILQVLPLNSSRKHQNTDIQQAESTIYKGLAQLNQCRLTGQLGVRSQSVVWLTDAPLSTPAGITSAVWVETPGDSPFRVPNSAASQERQEWLKVLPIQLRSQKIGNYNLSVADLAPTVQEFCTPAPGGRETCLVDGYLVRQLWLPALVLSIGFLAIAGGGFWLFLYWRSLQQSWKLTVADEHDSEQRIHYLRNHQKLGIGSDIECRGGETRGYLRREGNRLFLEPLQGEGLEIYYQNREVTQRQALAGKHIRLNCPHQSRDFELTININN